MNGIKQFSFFDNYYEVIKELPDKDKKEFLIAIVEYVFEDKKPSFKGINKGIWNLIERPLTISKNKGRNAKKEKSNENQNEIKLKSNQNQSHYSISSSISLSSLEDKKDSKGVIGEKEEKKETFDSKKIHFAEFVTMTNAEYQKLVSTHGKTFVDQCIKVLDNYKGSVGKKYKSDYRAILSWVIDKVNGTKTFSVTNLDKPKENIPEWFDKEQENVPMTAEEKEEIDKLLEEFK